MRKIGVCLLGLLLASCSIAEHNQENITKLTITKNCDLLLETIWPLQGTGNYLQKIHVKTKNHAHTFLLNLEIENYSLKAIAIHDIQGRIYDIHLTPDDLKWSAIPEIKDTLKPEYILIDFLLTHLSLAVLSKVSPTLHITEKKNVRIIKKNGEILRTIKMSNKQNNMWQTVKIHNPKQDYTLDIETVTE
ncbi:MAG TPA: hypothetical protein DIC42_01350 [Holosporales bacterium]|nr:hypothetical protein [Holosporales bacterium]